MTYRISSRKVGKIFATTALAALLSSTAFAETVIRRGNGGEPQTLDQAKISIDIEGFIVRDLFEGLTVYDANGKVAPGVAESWTISDDGTVYTFKLRDNAKWSDGSPVVAGDFVYSMTRVLDPATAAGYATILYPIKGAEAFNTSKGQADALGLKAVDDKTLEITLERATPYFLQLMTHYTAIPVNKANIEKFGADFTKPGNLVSNGAYELTEYVANDHITAVKNPDYWDAANVKIDKVIYNPSEDQAAVARAFEAGELDVAYNFQADQRDFLTKKLGEDQVQASPALATYYYAFDTRKPPFDDVRVRKALSIAVDRDFLSEKVYGGTQLPSYTFVPPGMEGYTSPTPADVDKDQLDREDEAKELLKEAGYGEGGKPLKIDIRYNTNENHKKVAVAVADMWKALGAEVTIQNLDVKSHYAYLQEGGSFDVARAGWSADYADPENFLNLLVSTNKAFNYGHYSNPKFDELMKASYEEKDQAKRMAILAEAEALVLNEYPVTPFMNNANLWLVSRKVKGFSQNAVNEHLTKYLSIE
ncbi:oligopeptide transport system substrate-binding protein [Rhizobium sp. RU20A]|uniref:peptide ABC transporter substrate-binding protein n=1 Tax=Rhizobium sp. RU20A TaxID=1907412 RepID=UPI000954CCD0|nr:peptide ABC transporter substrate-binding protein [Rhizobium sp. RU20A]SIQ52265.1 oligopeptide transport system substrate-binding protein [Rhizobium sp. RU20A]